MPYVFKEVLDEGEDEAAVVSRDDYDAVIQERDTVVTQRDAAIERAVTAEKGWADARNKYADAFLTSPARVKAGQASDVKRDSRPQTFEELFASREGN